MLRDPFSLRPSCPCSRPRCAGGGPPLPGLSGVRRGRAPRRPRARPDALRAAGASRSARRPARWSASRRKSASRRPGSAACSSATRGCSSTCSPPSSRRRSSASSRTRIDKIVVLAVFLPVLAGQSGNTGCQALAVTLRGITLGELQPGGARRLVAKEALLGLLQRRARRRHGRPRHVRSSPARRASRRR